MRRPQYLTIIIVLLALVFGVSSSSDSAAPAEPTYFGSVTNEVTLEDFDDILTPVDLGFNDFSGNMGTINDTYMPVSTLYCANPAACALRLDWNFGGGGEIFTGYFMSLFGLTDTLTTFDGTITETITFPEHTLNLNDIDGELIDPVRQFDEICMALTYDAVESVALKLELSDPDGGLRFTRKTINGSPTPQTICWDFRTDFTPGGTDLDLQKAKLFNLIIEQLNIGAGIDNPLTGRFDIDRVWFIMDQDEMEPAGDQALLDLMEKRAFQYFLDWSSRKADSLDIPQDRSTFGDLLTVGGIGFAIPAHIIGAERGWATRADSANRVLNILEILDNDAAFGSEPVGRIGYRGWFYHFLGVDGLRKRNFDFPATPTDESLNTVELSSIDTGLAVIGVLTAQSYFDDMNNQVEIDIRTHAQNIYDRVEWDFLLEPNINQYYLGWKPDEPYEGDDFEIPDGDGTGFFSGVENDPYTLDYYTDEALILLILGIGSETYPISSEAYQSMILYGEDDSLVRTFPGALFTYQFYHAFFGPDACNPNWYDNSQLAIQTVIDYATDNPGGFATYGPAAWGISADEGPFDDYSANGAPPVAVNAMPEEDGSITYYAMLSAAGYGPDLRQAATAALRAGWDRDHWHPRFGLPDAFHDDVSETQVPTGTLPLRQTGTWQNRALFAIDQGPMLMHLENSNSELIWKLLKGNPNIQRAFDRIAFLNPVHLFLEAEEGSGQGTIMPRSNAWGNETVWLHAGESRTMAFDSGIGAAVSITVRYSNDNNNNGPSETVSVLFDGINIGSFVAEDTGDNGNGWNVFVLSDRLSKEMISAGDHTIQVSISGGDGFGIEIDAVTVDYFGPKKLCSFIPVSLKD